MTATTAHLVARWIVILGGLIPSLYFVWSWRPRARFSARQLDAGGWVAVIAALYLLAAVRAATGQYEATPDVDDWLVTVGIGGAIDSVLWLRVFRWRAFRRDGDDHPLRRATDPAVDCEPDLP